MGSSSKKSKEKDRKRRYRSRSVSVEREAPREKKHKHHRRHHKDRKREKAVKHQEYDSDISDVIDLCSEKVSTPPPPSIEKTQQESGQSAESLSVQETNKLRAKLGLKPLAVKTVNVNDVNEKKKDDLGEFYHKPAHNLAEKAQQEKLKAKISEHREKRRVESKLARTRALGDSDSDGDTASWVHKNRKLEQAKKQAEKRAKMLEEMDAQFGIGDVIEAEQREKYRKKYTEKNLRGLRVEHNLDSFSEERSVVLTLKDSGILDEDEDVLVNVNMLDDERYKKSNENKKRKMPYNKFDGLEDKTILSKYDEEIDGKKREGFKIGHEDIAERQRLSLQNIRDKLSNKRVESIGETRLTLASEYYSEAELATFKKPKKKGRKIRGKSKLLVTDDTEMVDGISSRRSREQFSYVDVKPQMGNKLDAKEEEKDDVLERALQKARRLKQRENLNTNNTFTPNTAVKAEPLDANQESCSIVLNATAEFCRTLGDIPTYGKSGNREDNEELVDFEREIEEDEEEVTSEVDEGGKWSAVDPTRTREPVVAPIEVPILDVEPDVGSGVAAALRLAMSKGYLDKEENNRPSNSRLAHLQAKHYSIEDKSYGDEAERGGRRERYSGPIQDFKEKDTFKPNVKLEYIDDEGHILNSKEAFRYLSHKFHGKGPGKNKVEKRIKKSQQEGLMKKMSSTDTPLGTLNMLQAKQKEMQSPYIVLSGSKHTHSTTIAKARR